MPDDSVTAAAEIAFTNDWFDVTAKPVWDGLIPQINPSKILEIGSFEGASACYLIAACAAKAPIELHCIDTWEGGDEHKQAGTDMSSVEQRFLNNTRIARSRVLQPVELVTHKGRSDEHLARLIAGGFRQRFDLVYIDGSHYAHDVLSDAVLSFPLLKVGGHMIFDDYLWRGRFSRDDAMYGPKLGVDAFLNVYFHQMQLIWSPNSQVCARKVAD